MMTKVEIKAKAVSLRKQGKTYSEIQNIIGPLPKSTLSGWFKNIQLTSLQNDLIREKSRLSGYYGRQIGADMNHKKRLSRLKFLQDKAKDSFAFFSLDPLFIPGLVLYLAEGSKKYERFQFMNSDPYLIKFIMNWLIKFGHVSIRDISLRLFAHDIYDNQNYELFWSKFLNIPLNQFKKTILKKNTHTSMKNPNYKGCLRLEIPGSVFYWKIMKWRDMLYTQID